MPHGALDQSGSPLLYPRLGPINGNTPDGAPASVRACMCFGGDVCAGTMKLEAIFAQVAAGPLAVRCDGARTRAIHTRAASHWSVADYGTSPPRQGEASFSSNRRCPLHKWGAQL